MSRFSNFTKGYSTKHQSFKNSFIVRCSFNCEISKASSSMPMQSKMIQAVSNSARRWPFCKHLQESTIIWNLTYLDGIFQNHKLDFFNSYLHVSGNKHWSCRQSIIEKPIFPYINLNTKSRLQPIIDTTQLSFNSNDWINEAKTTN